MKRVLKHLIIGLILSAVLFIALVIWLNSIESETKMTFTQKFLIVLFGVIFGTIGFTLVKLWHDWFYSHFTVFTRNPLQLIIVTYIVDPIVGVIGFNILGYYLMYKIGVLNFLGNFFPK
jgi:hypothetical protein